MKRSVLQILKTVGEVYFLGRCLDCWPAIGLIVEGGLAFLHEVFADFGDCSHDVVEFELLFL